MGQLFAPRAFGSKKCVVLAFVVRPTIHSFIHSCFEFTSAEASGNLGFPRGTESKKYVFWIETHFRLGRVLVL